MAIVVPVKSFTVTNTPQPVVTLRAVARRVGLSLATVSYALRAHPKITLATRDLVSAAAIELGYRPNSRVAGLMAHIRSARACAAGGAHRLCVGAHEPACRGGKSLPARRI